MVRMVQMSSRTLRKRNAVRDKRAQKVEEPHIEDVQKAGAVLLNKLRKKQAVKRRRESPKIVAARRTSNTGSGMRAKDGQTRGGWIAKYKKAIPDRGKLKRTGYQEEDSDRSQGRIFKRVAKGLSENGRRRH